MKLRLDLLEHIKDEDVLTSVVENNHRYKPEPLFSETGTGSLSSPSIEECAQEVERSTEFVQELEQRARRGSREDHGRNRRSTPAARSCPGVEAPRRA